MSIRTIAAALTLLLLVTTLHAQEYLGYPEERVRFSKPESIPPDELYPANRIILRKTNLALAGSGMQITGEVVTDFEADRVPNGLTDVPKGQLTGIKVNVELYYWDTVFERDNGTLAKPGTGKIQMPQIDLARKGALVEGASVAERQSVTVTIDQIMGRFGKASFTLPPLTKPLAPGIYRLVASVRFKTQDAKIVEAIRWCSDWYGARPEQDPDTKEITFKNVMNNTELHDEVYDFLINTTGTLLDETHIWIGEVYKDGIVSLIPPEKGTDKVPANYLIWGYHLNIVELLLAFQDQLDNVDKVVDAALEQKLKLNGATDEHRERWKKEAVEEKKRIKRDNKPQIEKLGGRTSKDEDKRFLSAVPARLAILEQVGRLHDYLSRRYWVLTDGYLQYTGWNSIYNAGFNSCDAVQNNDERKTAAERKKNLKAAQDAEGGLAKKWETRREQWKYVPADMTAAAFAYLKTKEETDTHDAEKFTAKVGGKIELDIGKWAEFRMNFVLDFYEKSNAMFKQVTTTDIYAVQIWPQALNQLISARDDVIALTYAWEYYARHELMKEDAEIIKESWKREAQPIKALPLADYFGRAMTAPGTIKTRFDGCMTVIKSAAKIGDFKSAYSRAAAIEPKIDAKYLPGARPPSAPTKEG